MLEPLRHDPRTRTRQPGMMPRPRRPQRSTCSGWPHLSSSGTSAPFPSNAPTVACRTCRRRRAGARTCPESRASVPCASEWAEKGVRKEDHVMPWQRRMARKRAYGVYYIFKSMEQGPTFRVSVPKYPTKDPHHRILAPQRSRFTHYYFYIRDETLGPMMIRVASFFPFQTTYYLNGHSFIEQELNRARIGFRKTDNAFLAVADVAALQAAAEKLS